jgi:hypothetical protein
MSHWQHRPEPGWKKFEFNQPYAVGLKRLKEEVLAKTDFDPATLWQWGTMQAMAVIQILKDCEAAFGKDGQDVVYGALRKIGHDVGSQILEGCTPPADLTQAEYISYYATVINRIAYASLEAPQIVDENTATFDILWCPHQDTYKAFDCRVQRYFVQGMTEAFRDHAQSFGFDVRFDSTIPAGAPTCHFTMWRATPGQPAAWPDYTDHINRKALKHAEEARRAQPQTPPQP